MVYVWVPVNEAPEDGLVNAIEPAVEAVVDDVVDDVTVELDVEVAVVLVAAGAVYWKVVYPVAPNESVATTT